jgi:hypothetical protein
MRNYRNSPSLRQNVPTTPEPLETRRLLAATTLSIPVPPMLDGDARMGEVVDTPYGFGPLWSLDGTGPTFTAALPEGLLFNQSRGVMEFPLANVPAGSHINSAQLRFHVQDFRVGCPADSGGRRRGRGNGTWHDRTRPGRRPLAGPNRLVRVVQHADPVPRRPLRRGLKCLEQVKADIPRISYGDRRFPEGTALALEALAHPGLGNRDAARHSLTAADRLNGTMPRPGESDLGPGPDNWVVFQIVLREAHTTCGPTAPPKLTPAADAPPLRHMVGS